MLEFHFLHMDAHDARRIIPLHHHSEIGLVVKIGRTVYVIHFRSGRLPCYRIAVHLARMGHEHYQAVVSGGKAGEPVEQGREILRFGLSGPHVVFDPVQGVDNEDANPPPCHQFPALRQDGIHREVLFGQDMAYVLCQVAGDALVKPLRHSETGLETPGGELLRQLAEVETPSPFI